MLMATGLRRIVKVKAQYYICTEASCKCRLITILQVTYIITNKNKHTYDASFEDLEKERFRLELFDQIERNPTNQIKKYDR